MKFREAEKKWGYEFPAELEKIRQLEPNQGVLINNALVVAPWPPLSETEITSAHDVALDWNIKQSYVPIMGDFHDLVCLDYSNNSCPEVVIINDLREELICYKSLNNFLLSLVNLPEEDMDTKGIIEEESWLDF
jgi:hypothetical protein